MYHMPAEVDSLFTKPFSVLTAIVCRLPFLTGRSLGSPAPRIHQIAHPFRWMDYQLSSDLIGLVVSVESSFSQQPCAGEAGLPVLSTPTKILFCDLTLAPGERQVAEYQETIPPSASPSYRGTSVKYSYKVVHQKMLFVEFCSPLSQLQPR